MHTQEMSYKANAPLTECSFPYPTLPPEPYTTRMIRLLPHEDENGPIQCELFNYNLSHTGGGKHLYEALSYVWGSEDRSKAITLNGCTFRVTKNLHSALLHLRTASFKEHYGSMQIIELLLQHRGDSLPISAEVVKAAAGNSRQHGPQIMELLLQHRGDSPK